MEIKLPIYDKYAYNGCNRARQASLQCSNRRVFYSSFMQKEKYTKPAFTREEQVDQLSSRGLIIKDKDYALSMLHHVNYYRLGAYWLPFEEDHENHIFKKNTTFEDVVDLYEFDRRLRLIILDAIERLEVSIRAQWTYHLSHAYGSHAHLIEKAYNPKYWKDNYQKMTKEVERADEIFINHLMSRYSEDLPPIWAVSEVMSLGGLSRWFKSIKSNKIRKDIAKEYGIVAPFLDSWLHHLSIVRNVCAHHSKLWNRRFDLIPPKVKEEYLNVISDEKSIYNSLTIILYLIQIIDPNSKWKSRLLELIDSREKGVLLEMGFPDNWKDNSLWQ